MTKDDFQELRQSMIDGNNESLRFAFEAHAAYCMNYLIRKKNCAPDDASDIFIDAIINFREKVISGQMEYLTSLRAYLSSTCVNMFNERRRRAQSDQKKNEQMRLHLSESDHIIERSSSREFLKYISRESLKTLDKRCQKLLKLFYVEGLSMKDIAKVMGFSNANVAKTMKSRCYKKWITTAHEMQAGEKPKG